MHPTIESSQTFPLTFPRRQLLQFAPEIAVTFIYQYVTFFILTRFFLSQNSNPERRVIIKETITEIKYHRVC